MSKKSVLCIASSRSQSETILDQLKNSGFCTNDISVLLPDREGTRDFAHEKHTKAPEGAATGAGAGGIVGGTLGLLAGIGLLAVPGVGPFLAAGPIMAALSGIAVGAAAGGVAGGLIGLGIPEYEAKRYESKIKDGGILISVHAESSDEISRAKRIFENAGAKDISSTGEASVPSKNAEPAATVPQGVGRVDDRSPSHGVLVTETPAMAGTTSFEQIQGRANAPMNPVR